MSYRSESGREWCRPSIGMAAFVVVWSGVAWTVAMGVVGGLPRSMHGEAVVLPLPVCLSGCFAAVVVPPWLGSRWVLKSSRARVVLLGMLVAAPLVCFWLDGAGVPTKAWRRGW